jgi:hypothetical protein
MKRTSLSTEFISLKAAVFRNFQNLGALRGMGKNHRITFLIALQNG